MGLIDFADETASVNGRARRSQVLVQRHAVHFARGEDGRDLIFVDARNVGDGGKTAQVAGAVHRGIDHLAADDLALAADMAGKAAGGRGTRHRGSGNSHIVTGGHAGIIILRGAQETGDYTALGGGVDGGPAEGHIGQGAVQHPGETRIGDTAGLQAADGMAPAVQADALVEGCRVVERDPVGDAGSVDILHELEMGQGFTDQNSGFVDVVQLPGGGDQVGIFLGTVATQEILQG